MADGTQGYSTIFPSDSLGSFNPTAAIIAGMLARVRTVLWAKVVSVDAPTSPNAPITVQVQPLVSMTDSQGNAFPHGEISAIPALRIMSGLGAIICDPVVGDVGFLLVCDRDSSSAQQNLAVSAPPTGRMFDMADAVFFGGWGNETPPAFIKFRADGGITWQDALNNSMVSGVGFVNFITGALQVNGVPVVVP